LVVDADEIRRQGKELADKLRHGAGEQIAQHEEKIKETITKVVEFVNAKTDGKYAEQVGKAASFVEHGVDRLAAEGRPAESPEATSTAESTPGAATPETPNTAPAADASPTAAPTADAPSAEAPSKRAAETGQGSAEGKVSGSEGKASTGEDAPRTG
jgi:MT0933-like antitoxin protein